MRRKYIKELLAVLDRTWYQYCADRLDTTEGLAQIVSLGVFAHAIHHHLGYHPRLATYYGSEVFMT